MTIFRDEKFVFVRACLVTAALLATGAAQAVSQNSTQPVLSDVFMLEKIGANVLATQGEVGFAELTIAQQAELSALAHDYRKCGGFEVLPFNSGLNTKNPLLTEAFGALADREQRDRHFRPSSNLFSSMTFNSDIAAAVDEVSSDNLKSTVAFMSNFPNRLHNGENKDTSVAALQKRIADTVKGAKLDVSIELITHNSTPQKSIRARITGATRPNEIIALGAHLDSINQEWWGDTDRAPGADDNASGSSNILEALRIIANHERPERTIEFFWYAGEEAGLLGSAEIARQYKSAGKDVIAVLQLDMTLFPGAGKFVLGSMTDYTSSWLRSYFENLNSLYVKAQIVDDQCGYGCSDHASWYRQGYPTLMPFEATFNGMNHNLHTSKDAIDENSSFEHSAMFSKIAVAMVLDLGNSTLREPK